MISDQHVREQVLDISQSFLIQAPAGSGKTSLLVQRFLSALATAQGGPEEIVAITFTRKAATEMRDRILNALELGSQTAPPSNAYDLNLWHLARRVLQRDQQDGWQLLSNAARLKVQTIDALSASITKRMPILSRFGAQPKIEPQPEQLYARAVDQFLLTVAGNCAWQNSLLLLLRYLDNDRIKVKKLLIRMLVIREQWLPQLANNMHKQDIRSKLEQGLQFAVDEAIEQLLPLVPDDLDFSILQSEYPNDLPEWLVVAAKLLTTTGEWRRTVTVREGFLAPSSTKDKQEKILLQQRKDAMLLMLEQMGQHENFRLQLDSLRMLPPTIYNQQQWGIVAALAEVLPVLAAQLTVVFKDQGQVDFSEVSLAAIHALADQNAPSDLALELDCKIRHILVDEFQDTSHTQYRLLEQLTASWDPGDGRTLFLVGDPMQSIYRFRQAEVGLYLKAKQYGIGNIKLNFAQLTMNFRSNANVIHWINQVFSQSFPQIDDMTIGAISYMPSHAADIAVLPDAAVQCIAIEAAAEAMQIVEIINNNRAQNHNCSIAILVRAKSHLLNLLPILRQHNIEFQGVEIEVLRERALIQDLLSLTNALLHLDDRIAWLAILRSPWCGLKLADLHVIANTEHTIWFALQQASVLQMLTTDAQLRLQRFTVICSDALAQLGRQTIDVIVKHAWIALGGPQCLADSNAHQEADAFLKLLASLSEKRELFTPGFLELQLNKLFLPNITINPHAVQIMTIHKAKGLEFDVVILPSLDKSTRSNEQQLLLLEQRDFEHKYLLIAAIRAADEKEDPIYDYLAWCEKQRQNYEALRLFYVAATRARSKIYCLAAIGDQLAAEDSLLYKIWPVVGAQFVAKDCVAPIQDTVARTISRLPIQWFKDNEYIPKQISAVDTKFKPWQQDWLRLAGIVMHRTLWQIVNEGGSIWSTDRLQQQQEVWSQHLRQLGVSQQYHAQALQIIAQAITNALQDPQAANILLVQHTESYAEWRLTRRLGEEFEHVILDRAFLTNENVFWVVDYKLVYERDDLPQAIQEYTPQLLKYAQVVRGLRAGVKVIASLYFPLQQYLHLI